MLAGMTLAATEGRCRMVALVATVWMIGSDTLPGSEPFPRPLLVPLEDRPAVIHAVDLNGDGWIDLTTAQSSTATIGVFLNFGDSTGAGLFASPRIYPVGVSPLVIESGDLDGENGLDLIVVNSGSGDVSTLFNRGDGRVVSGSPINVGIDPRVARLGDIDRDGDLDLVVGNVSSKELQLHLGDARGKFPDKSDITIGGNPHALALEDFDGDGLLDLAPVYANSFVGGVQWLQGTGNGKFESPIKTSLERVNDAVPRFIATGDMNLDGLLDLAVLTDDEKFLKLEFGRDGRFEVELVAQLTVPRVEFLARSDFDRDGFLDFMVPVEDSGNAGVRVYRGNSKGELTFLTDIFFAGSLKDVLFIDLDKDGALDMAGAQTGPNGLSVVRGTGPGRLGVRISVPLGVAPRGLQALDLDADGVFELAAVSASAIHLVRGTASGSFERFSKVTLPGRAFEDIAVGHLGNGSPPTLALLDLAQAEVLLVSLDSQGEVVQTRDLSVGELPQRFALGDVNADGTDDLVVTSLADNDLSILILEQGGGTVARRIKVDVGAPQTAVDFGDLDNDGLLDIAVGTKTTLKLLKNLELGKVFEARELQEYRSPSSLCIFQPEGEPTASLAMSFGEEVIVLGALQNQGAIELARIDFESRVESLLIADADGDGLPDVLAGTEAAIGFGRARPDGKYERLEFFPVGSSPRSVVVASLFPGGHIDCATADFNSRGLSILSGTGTPSNVKGWFRRGDVDSDGALLMTDAVLILYALFRTGDTLACADAADTDDSGSVNITDVILLLHYLFRGGATLPPPGVQICGQDRTPDELRCETTCK